MNVLDTIPQNWRRRLLVAGCACLLVALGAAGGAWVHPRKVVVEDTRAKEQLKLEQAKTIALSQELATVRKQLVDLQTTTTVDTTRRPDGTVTSHRVTRTEKKTETQTDTKKTEEKHEEVATKEDRTTEVDLHRVTTVSPEGRWSFRVLAGADTGGSVVAGAGVDYRLVGPLTVGAWALGPVAGAPGRFTVGISAGLRLP